MPSHGLSPDTRLSVLLDAICSRNRYTQDPAPVVTELLATAGDRHDILTESVGTWVGYFEDDDTRTLCVALRELPDLEPWIAVGRERFAAPHHKTPGFPSARHEAPRPSRVCASARSSDTKTR